MAKIRRYYYNPVGVIQSLIYEDTRLVAAFEYLVPDKLNIVPRYNFDNYHILTLGEYNYEVFLFIRRVSKLVADGSMREWKSAHSGDIEIDIPSEDALF